jgi:hypothetical protein
MQQQDGFQNEGIKDNVDFAVYAKLNQLAERHGLKPCDFIATLKNGPGEDMRLEFQYHPPEGTALAGSYDTMLRNLRIPEDSNRLEAPIEKILDNLDNALKLAPKPRRRF